MSVLKRKKKKNACDKKSDDAEGKVQHYAPLHALPKNWKSWVNSAFTQSLRYTSKTEQNNFLNIFFFLNTHDIFSLCDNINSLSNILVLSSFAVSTLWF